jgi:hypothetical protein
MRDSAIWSKLLFLLPMVLAVGIWAGHQTLASDLLEHHPQYPIELATFMAPVPEAPAPVVFLARGPWVRLPLITEIVLTPGDAAYVLWRSRGPPALA